MPGIVSGTRKFSVNVNELVCQEGGSVKALSPSWDSETGRQENGGGNAARLTPVP